MKKKIVVGEAELAEFAKSAREMAGKSKAAVARELKVSKPSVTNAEDRPDLSLTKLRIRIIETYSKKKVSGPLYQIDA